MTELFLYQYLQLISVLAQTFHVCVQSRAVSLKLCTVEPQGSDHNIKEFLRGNYVGSNAVKYNYINLILVRPPLSIVFIFDVSYPNCCFP